MTLQRRKFGETGLEVSTLGFGGAEIGLNHIDQRIVDRLLGTALDAGLNVIDTAECYGDSEVLIGNAIHRRRSDVLLFTKCGHAFGFDDENWTPELLEAGIERSLRRLQTDHLDLVQLHTCSEDVLRRGDVILALQRSQRAGKTRFIGYSGDGNAALYAVQCGAFDTLQTSVNIADQEAIKLTLPQARNRGMGVIAKRPIANAVWTRSDRPEYSEGDYWDRLQELDYDFLRTATLPEQLAVALQFALGQPGVHTAIVGTTNLEHLTSNIAAAGRLSLSVEDLAGIRLHWERVARADWVGLG